MSVSQLSHNSDWIQPSVLRKSTRDNFKRFRISLETISFHSRKSFAILTQLMTQLDLWASSSSNQSSLLYQTTDDTQSIVDTSLSLLKYKSVRTVDDNADSLGWGLCSTDLDDIRSTLGVSLFNKLSSSELVLRERLDISNWLATSRLEMLEQVAIPCR
jgi:hypothetical protein